MKDSKSAWESYEKGYEAMGGQDFQGRAKFGEKGFLRDLFSGPSGEAFIGEGKDRKRYDIGDITRAGKFLSSDAGAILDEGTKAEYLSSTVRGQAATQTGKLNSSLRTMTGDMNTGFGSGLGTWRSNQTASGEDSSSGMGITTGYDKDAWFTKIRGWDDKSGGEFATYRKDVNLLDGKNLGLDEFEQGKLKRIEEGLERDLEGKELNQKRLQRKIQEERAKFARSELELQQRKDQQAQELQQQRELSGTQRKNAWNEYMASSPELSKEQQAGASAMEKFFLQRLQSEMNNPNSIYKSALETYND